MTIPAMPNPPPSLIAAIVPQKPRGNDEMLAEFARSLIAQGVRVRGLIQENEAGGQLCEIILIDLDDNTRYPITQDLGACSTACRLDTTALSESSVVLRRIGKDGADLVIINRFGKQEAEGQGFAAEMLDLMSREIPVLTIVQPKYLESWREFTGGLSAEIPGVRAALASWFAQIRTH